MHNLGMPVRNAFSYLSHDIARRHTASYDMSHSVKAPLLTLFLYRTLSEGATDSSAKTFSQLMLKSFAIRKTFCPLCMNAVTDLVDQLFFCRNWISTHF